MRIIRKSDLILKVSEEWDYQYKNTTQEDKIEKGNRLRTEKPQTEEAIEKIIGTKSWTRNECDECGNDCDITIQLGEEPDFESNTANICPECLKKALSLL